MINIVLYNLSKSFYEYKPENDMVYVAPGPMYADALRSNLKNPNAEVTTMAQFLRGLLNEYLTVDKKKNYKSKSQLLLTLGVAWKQLDIGNFAQFKNAFMLLTDLRGYTQDEVLLESLLEEFDPTLGEIVLKMNSLMKNLDILDEHAAYWHLTQGYDGQVPSLKLKTFCFWGFDFLSPVQVDFLKAFARYHDVIIPLPQEVYANSIQSDWIQWLDSSENTLMLDNVELECQSKVTTFPKGYLSKALEDFLKDKKTSVDIYLATRTINSEEVQSIPSSDHFYKVSTAVFADRLAGVDKQLKQILRDQNDLGRQDFIDCVGILKEQALKQKDYIGLKVYQIYLEAIDKWDELTDAEFYFDWFMSELMSETVGLDLPRLSLLPLVAKSSGKILSLSDLHSLNTDGENWLCITSNFLESRSSNSLYSNTTETKLLQIGPLRRSGLEELFTISKLKELLFQKSTTVLIEKGVKEKSQLWHELLAETLEESIPLSFYKGKSNSLPEVKVGPEFKLLEITPSKLQSFINCPRKFYHDYLDGIFPKVKLQKYLSPLNSGELAHNIIEKYVKQPNMTAIDDLIERSLHNFYSDHSISPTIDIHYEYLAQLRLKTFPVSNELLKLQQCSGGKFIFEEKIEMNLEQVTRNGRCDLFFECDSFQALIDFKSSDFGIPNINAFMSYEQIQLWFYLNLFELAGKLDLSKPIFLGYINLSQLDKSLFIKIGAQKDPSWFSELNIFSKCYEIPKDFSEVISEYKKIEKNIIELVQRENEFLPRPFQENVCTYCAIKTICPRGTVS